MSAPRRWPLKSGRHFCDDVAQTLMSAGRPLGRRLRTPDVMEFLLSPFLVAHALLRAASTLLSTLRGRETPGNAENGSRLCPRGIKNPEAISGVRRLISALRGDVMSLSKKGREERGTAPGGNVTGGRNRSAGTSLGACRHECLRHVPSTSDPKVSGECLRHENWLDR